MRGTERHKSKKTHTIQLTAAQEEVAGHDAQGSEHAAEDGSERNVSSLEWEEKGTKERRSTCDRRGQRWESHRQEPKRRHLHVRNKNK